MKCLVAEDDFSSRLLLQYALRKYGTCDAAANGRQAIDAVSASLLSGAPYDLVCLDITMPERDGQAVLREIRAMEKRLGTNPPIRVLMTTAHRDKDNLLAAFREQCDGYLVKPVHVGMVLKVTVHGIPAAPSTPTRPAWLSDRTADRLS